MPARLVTQPVPLFSLDGRPHLVHVRVEQTDVSAYQVLLQETFTSEVLS